MKKLHLNLLVAAAALGLAASAPAEEILGRFTDGFRSSLKSDATSGAKHLEIDETKYSYALSELLPVVPGCEYRFRMRRHGAPAANIDLRVLLYDEDLHLVREGEYPKEWNVPWLTVYANWDEEAQKRNWRTLVPRPGVAFAKLLVTSEKVARVASVEWVAPTNAPAAAPTPCDSPYEVVVPTRKSEPLAFAAAELRHWIRRISGKRVALVAADAVGPSAKKRIYLGRDFLKGDTGRYDSWRIAPGKGGDVFLAANRDDGVCNAVYDLLERNTDLVVARSERNPGAVVFTPDPGLAFTNVTSHVVPAFERRDFGFVGRHFDPATKLYCRRNFMNHVGGYYAKWHLFSAGTTVFRRVLFYEYGRLLPNETYFRDHPEFYGMREEKRRAYEHYGTQICYTNPEGRKEIAKNLIASIRRDIGPGVELVGVGYGDTWDLCRCPTCVKPVTLPSGRVLTEDDADFRSYQFYTFAVAIAKEVAREFPDLAFDSGGYLYSAIPPPELKFPKNYAVTFCPYPKVCRVPVYDETRNKKWRDASVGWGKSGAGVSIYEYYGDAISWPRPGADNAAKDMRWWLALGGFGTFMYCEMPPDYRDPAGTDKFGYAAAWDLSAMENWVMARLFVDPSRDVAALRRDFCRRAFRTAADDVLAFYAKIHERWYANPEYQGWGENAVNSMNADIRPKGLEKPLRELLVKAEAKADHPASKDLIRQMIRQWDVIVAAAEKAAPPARKIPYAKVAADALPGFADAVWRDARAETNFTCKLVRGATNLATRTEARAFHDNRFLYVRFLCEGKAGASGAEKTWMPDGDSVAVFVRAGKDLHDYTQYRAYASGAGYDAKGYDGAWTAEGFRVKVDSQEKAWRAILRVPLSAAGVNPTVPGETFLDFVRTTGRGDAWRSYTTSGKSPHAPSVPYVIEAQ